LSGTNATKGQKPEGTHRKKGTQEKRWKGEDFRGEKSPQSGRGRENVNVHGNFFRREGKKHGRSTEMKPSEGKKNPNATIKRKRKRKSNQTEFFRDAMSPPGGGTKIYSVKKSGREEKREENEKEGTSLMREGKKEEKRQPFIRAWGKNQ